MGGGQVGGGIRQGQVGGGVQVAGGRGSDGPTTYEGSRAVCKSRSDSCCRGSGNNQGLLRGILWAAGCPPLHAQGPQLMCACQVRR